MSDQKNSPHAEMKSTDKVTTIKANNKSSKRLRSSIKKDPVHPSSYNNYKLPWSCDDCSHFAHETESCTLGYNSLNHRRVQQKFDYELGGHYALCRFQEID